MPTNNSLAGYKAHRKPVEKVKYRRKPKAERVPPIKKFTITYCPFEEAVMDVALSNIAYEKGAYNNPAYVNTPVVQKIHKETLSYHVNERGVTLIVQRSVVRWNSKAKKPYPKDETTCVRSIFLTSQGNVHYYFYDVVIDQNGRKTRNVHSAFDTYAANIRTSNEAYYLGQPTTWRKVLEGEVPQLNQKDPFLLLRAYFESITGKSAALEDVYPMRQYLGHSGNCLLPGTVMRSSTPQQVALELFGKRKYRKDLVKAIGKDTFAPGSPWSRAQRLYWASLFKNVVPTDWIVDYLANNRVDQGYMTPEVEMCSPLDSKDRQVFQGIMLYLKPAERRNILNNGMTRHAWNDFSLAWRRAVTRGTYTDILPANRDSIKSFDDLHDKWFGAQRHHEMIERRKRDAERYLPKNMWVNKDEASAKTAWFMEHLMPLPYGLTIQIARDYDVLFKWSDLMNNCISSYFNTANVILGGIYRGEELLANFEIRQRREQKQQVPRPPAYRNYGEYNPHKLVPMETVYQNTYHLNQLLGIRNSRLDDDLRDTLGSHFKSAGFDLPQGIWW